MLLANLPQQPDLLGSERSANKQGGDGRQAREGSKMIVPERATGFEPATSSLGSWHSTTELRPHHSTVNPSGVPYFGQAAGPANRRNCQFLSQFLPGFLSDQAEKAGSLPCKVFCRDAWIGHRLERHIEVDAGGCEADLSQDASTPAPGVGEAGSR
jgi:hypothetical protein